MCAFMLMKYTKGVQNALHLASATHSWSLLHDVHLSRPFQVRPSFLLYNQQHKTTEECGINYSRLSQILHYSTVMLSCRCKHISISQYCSGL